MIAVDTLVERARAAQKVAPGPWEADGEETESGWGKHDEFVLLDANGVRMCGTENADAGFGSISEEHDGDGGHWQWNEHSRVLMHFIAACDPTTVLGLVARIAALEAENGALRDALSTSRLGHVMVISFLQRDKGSNRIAATVESLIAECVKFDEADRAALRQAEEKQP